MAKRKIFYSFHFDNDVMRVQLIRNMGIVEGDTPVSPNEWEKLQKKEGGVKAWINNNMYDKSCVIVLVGTDTYKRPWVKYEIEKAWNDGRGLFGIHIHNLTCPNNGTCTQGTNPFTQFTFKHGDNIITPKCYNPKSSDAYNDISANLDAWVEEAITSRSK